MRVGRRRRSAPARHPRRRQPDWRQPHRRHLAHEGPRSSREGVGRCRAGDRGRERSRPLRLGPAAVAIQAARGRRAADHRPLLVGGIAARDRRRDRRQRKHDAGDAAAEELGEEVPVGARPQGPSDAGGLQRQHVHAHEPRDQRAAARSAPSTGCRPGAARRCTT